MVTVPSVFTSKKSLARGIAWANAGEWAQFVVPLDCGNVSVEGLRLRGAAYMAQPDREVMLQLEWVASPVRIGPLERIDWKPFHTHSNRNKGPEHLRFIQIRGSHHHQFELNWLGDQGRMRSGNLPIAVPFGDELTNVKDIFAFAEERFRISGLSKETLPSWQGELFRKPK